MWLGVRKAYNDMGEVEAAWELSLSPPLSRTLITGMSFTLMDRLLLPKDVLELISVNLGYH